jgi:hypothetical protein
MRTELLFVDDTDAGATTGALALTGVLVDVSRYDAVRTDFCTMKRQLFPDPPNTVNTSPPEYHGSALFKGVPEATDDHRVRAHRDMVTLCNRHELDVVRCGYWNGRELDQTSPGVAITLCWFGLLDMLQDRLADRTIIPVMDQCKEKTARSISGSMKNTDILRTAMPDRHFLSRRNTENVLGEVFYADSAMSVFVQVADMLGYMLHARDCVERQSPASAYKQLVASLSADLAPGRLTECLQTVQISCRP